MSLDYVHFNNNRLKGILWAVNASLSKIIGSIWVLSGLNVRRLYSHD